jgi:hypothetical protein
MRNFQALLFSFLVLTSSVSWGVSENCNGMSDLTKIQNQIEIGQKTLLSFTSSTDKQFRVFTRRSLIPPAKTIKYLIQDEEITPSPFSLEKDSKAFWGVDLNHPSRVIIVILDSDGNVTEAELGFIILLKKRGVSTPTGFAMFSQLKALKDGFTLEGSSKQKVWSLRFKSLSNYLEAFRILQTFPQYELKSIHLSYPLE